MLSKQEVQHIAKLARLGLTETEIGKFQKDLSQILDYMEKLKEVDVSDITPTSHSIKVENIIREDATRKLDNQRTGKILNLAPETKAGYLKVKAILNEK